MTAEVQALMAHAGWVRDLAHRLVRDPELADDLSQETMLAALKGRGGPIRSTRAWLGTVLRNLLWERLRGESRRQHRERKAARSEAVPSSAEVVERVDAHRAVVNAVMSLPEHYRIVLLRRYYEGETPTEIAERLAMPLPTVKTRLQRGLEKLRTALDDAHGGDGARWRKALAPLLIPPYTGPIPAPPVALPMRGLIFACGAILAFVVVLRVVDPGPSEPMPGVPVGSVTMPIEVGLPRAPDGPASGAPERREAATATPVAWGVEEDATRLPTRPLRGHVFFGDGRPAPGVLVRFTSSWKEGVAAGSGTPVALSRGDGSFELRAYGPGMVHAARTDLATLLAGVATNSSVREGLAVVVAPERELRGRVRDPAGNGLADARLEVAPPPDLVSRLGLSLRSAVPPRRTARTGERGVFALPGVPALAGATLRVRCDGFVARIVELPEAMPPGGLEVVLQPPPEGPGIVRGVVLDAGGAPVAGARVTCGTAVARTDAGGGFRLDTWREGPPGRYATRLCAYAPDRLPAFLDCAGADDSGRPRWPSDPVLQLGDAPRAVSGRVVDPTGRGIAAARVWLADPTVFAVDPHGMQSNDEWRSGPHPDLRPLPRVEVLENMLAGESDDVWRPVKTDAEGAFSIDGLADRDYTVIAMDPTTLQTTPPVVARAGARGVTLTVDRSVLRGKVSGRILDRAGRPVAGVSVFLQVPVFALEYAGASVARHGRLRYAMVTGADGGFWVYDVPPGAVLLRFEGSGIVPRLHEVPGGAQPPPVEVIVARRVSLRVAAGDPASVDEVAVADADGNVLAVELLQGPRRRRLERVPVRAGRSGVFEAPDEGAWLLVFRSGELLRRVALQVAGPGVHEIRL